MLIAPPFPVVTRVPVPMFNTPLVCKFPIVTLFNAASVALLIVLLVQSILPAWTDTPDVPVGPIRTVPPDTWFVPMLKN